MAEKSVINNIESQVRQLIAEYDRLSQHCRIVAEERDALKRENRSLQGHIKELDKELSKMQLSEGLGGESSNKQKARARVNRLLREVDKCIAMLDTPGKA